MKKQERNLKAKVLTVIIALLLVVQSNYAQIGVFHVTGNVTLASSQNYEVQLKDLTGSGSGHDQIDVTGDLSLGGTLTIILDGYTPNADDEFLIMKYSGTLDENLNTFSAINWPPLMSSTNWKIDYGVFGSSAMINVGLHASAIAIITL